METGEEYFRVIILINADQCHRKVTVMNSPVTLRAYGYEIGAGVSASV